MATAEPPKPVTGVLYKRQRGLKSNSKDSKGLKWQRRTIRLMPNAIEYYGVKATTPNGSFPVQRIKIVTKIPEDTFRKKYCFQVSDSTPSSIINDQYVNTFNTMLYLKHYLEGWGQDGSHLFQSKDR